MKAKKLLSSILVLAMILSAMGTIAFADNTDVIVLDAGTYTWESRFAGKTVKAADGAEVILDMTTVTMPGLGGADVTFEGITFNWNNSVSYTGLQHSGNLTYNNCVINGQVFLFGASETFNDCTFNQDNIDLYNVWTYSAKKVTFNNCTFNSAGRCLLVYADGGDAGSVDVKNTTFNASTAVDGKAAIEIDTSLMTGKATVTVDDETVAVGFGEGSKSGNTLWNVKTEPKQKESSVVVSVADETAYAKVVDNAGTASDIVATVDGEYYGSLEAAIAAAITDDVVVLCSDLRYDDVVYASGKTTSINVPAGKKFTLDLNGHTISGTNSSAGSFELMTICNGAILTIDDSSAAKTGKITLEMQREVPNGWMNRAHTIYNQGTLILNNGTIENATPESQEAVSSAVDNNCSWGNLGKFVMNGGTVTSAGYYSVRTDVNTHNVTANGTNVAVTEFNGGTIYGFYLMDRGSDIASWAANDIDVTFGDNSVVQPANYSSANGTAVRVRYGSRSVVDIDVSDDAEINGKFIGVVAKTGGKLYNTLEAAIAAADTGDTIDLLGNVIAINESKDNFDASKNLTFENGTLDLTYAGSSDSMFTLNGSETLTFNNVDFVKRDIGLDAKFMCYFINVGSANAVLTFNNCDFDLDGGYLEPQWPGNGIWSSYIANNGGGKIYFTDCNIESEYANFIYQGGATITNCTYDGYADLDEGDQAGNLINHNIFPTVISNSKIRTRILGLRNANSTVQIKDNTHINASLVRISTPLTDSDVAPVYVDATSEIEAETLDSTIINSASEGKVVSKADSVYVQFAKTDVDAAGSDNLEGADTYDIILLGGNAEKINELASADLSFVFDPTPVAGGAMSYEITPAEGVTLTKIADRYMFNYDGVAKYEETGVAIKIGAVKFEGYGAYNFSTAEVTTNAVYATEIRDNIVDGFEDAANLLINADAVDNDGMIGKIAGAEIKVPTRTLTINIAFPNAVVDKAAAYQDMKVEITGNIDGVNKTVKYDLGGNMTTDGKYVVENDKLVLNNAYTVTVSGAGYRTARYTVTMTGNKELNFWNNVMDEAKEVEVGKDSSKTIKNFLAGDIVKDNNINIYDLSAVVSYFASASTIENGYAKYDLNRDGVIDSKDVAYVLVSWNN